MAVAHLRLAPTSSASISVADRLSPSGVSQLRWRSRPVTMTRSPLARESARCSAVDFSVVEGAGGDQVVEVAGRLPQLAVAVADRGGGDPGELFGQHCPGVPSTRGVAGGRELDPTRRSLELGRLEPLEQHRGNPVRWSGEIAPGCPPVGAAGGMTAGWGDHIATPAPPVHMGQAPRLDVAQVGGGQVDAPLGCQLTTAAVMSR